MGFEIKQGMIRICGTKLRIWLESLCRLGKSFGFMTKMEIKMKVITEMALWRESFE